jgi:hypothetical protein
VVPHARAGVLTRRRGVTEMHRRRLKEGKGRTETDTAKRHQGTLRMAGNCHPDSKNHGEIPHRIAQEPTMGMS